MPKTLKAKNLKFIVIMLIVDIAILMMTPLSDKISSLLAPNNWLFCLVESATIIMIAALLINNLLSPNLKAVIVFWRLWNVLPGCRAFSKFVHRDSRIDINTLEKKLGIFPKAAKVNWRIIDNLIFPICDLINKKYYKPFRLVFKESISKALNSTPLIIFLAELINSSC